MQKNINFGILIALTILAPLHAFADTPSTQSNCPSTIWAPVISALIGVFSALATPFVRDLCIQIWNDKRIKSDRQHEIFRNYAAPLAGSAEKLVWRFCEIFIDNRHHFLKTATLPLVYNDYKRKSTLYRIASLLGWIRAINLELSSLPRGASGFLVPISDAIQKVQKALADGPHVEVHRLEQLCAVWRLDLSAMEEPNKKYLATRVEVKLYELAGDSLKHDSNHLKNMLEEDKKSICTSLSEFLCKELKRAKLLDGIVYETVNQAIAAMSYREALIYRDWQDAIGDAMLELDPDSVRRYKIIGYDRFEQLLEGESLWIEVFRDGINDIDFESIDPNDFRSKQLKDLSMAVSEILISLSKTNEKDLIGKNALNVANKLLNLA